MAASTDTGPIGKLKAAARALYTQQPSEAELAIWGLRPDDFTEDALSVWPDNWAAVEFFSYVGAGAWNIGYSGPIGIRPEAYREVRCGLGVTDEQWRDIFRDVCVLEAEAIETMKKASK